jgi:hypothetical protein
MPAPIIVGVALRDDDSAPLALAHRLARLTVVPSALVTSYPYGRITAVRGFRWARSDAPAARTRARATGGHVARRREPVHLCPARDDGGARPTRRSDRD